MPRRISAATIEDTLKSALARLMPGNKEYLFSSLTRVEVYAAGVHLLLPIGLLVHLRSRLGRGETVEPDPADPSLLWLILPPRMRIRDGRT